MWREQTNLWTAMAARVCLVIGWGWLTTTKRWREVKPTHTSVNTAINIRAHTPVRYWGGCVGGQWSRGEGGSSCLVGADVGFVWPWRALRRHTHRPWHIRLSRLIKTAGELLLSTRSDRSGGDRSQAVECWERSWGGLLRCLSWPGSRRSQQEVSVCSTFSAHGHLPPLWWVQVLSIKKKTQGTF